jgi:hypothetical protein
MRERKPVIYRPKNRSGRFRIKRSIGFKKEIAVKEEEVPGVLKIVRFRLSQEALNNFMKHSQADRVKLSLKRMDPGTELTISDNGVGFDVDQIMSGGLAEREGPRSCRQEGANNALKWGIIHRIAKRGRNHRTGLLGEEDGAALPHRVFPIDS